jgi:hypothetical protein
MMKKFNKIIHDETAYLESMGRLDRETVYEALRSGGEGVVLRVCLGATTDPMPLRVLGYAASAQVVQEQYLPHSQLQFVHPLHAAEAANRVPVEQSKPVVEVFVSACLENFGQSDYDRTYLTDSPGSVDADLNAAVQEVLADRPDVAAPLNAAASNRQGDVASYVASHLVMHDSDPPLSPLNPTSPEAKSAKILISVGAQSERMFYVARMACRQAEVMPQGADAKTGQLFTRHVLPPYLACRQGEPSLTDYLQQVDGAYVIRTEHPVPSVGRDLSFLAKHLSQLSDGVIPAEGTV